MIWITTDGDWLPVADHLRRSLEAMGECVQVLDVHRLAELAVEIDGAALRVFDGPTEMELPKAIVPFRIPLPVEEDLEGLAGDARAFVTQQWLWMITGLFGALESQGTPVLNSPATALLDEKTQQMVLAANAGFTTGLTVQTARGHALRQTWSSEESLAVKPFRSLIRKRPSVGRQQRLKRIALDCETLADGLDAASVPSPSVVQEFADASCEHRVVVVQDQVFGARRKREGRTSIDVRSMPVSEMDVTASELPAEVKASARQLVQMAGARYATIDLLETQTGDFIFLDLNCAGHFYWVEQLTGAPIVQSIADMVIRSASSAVVLAGT